MLNNSEISLNCYSWFEMIQKFSIQLILIHSSFHHSLIHKPFNTYSLHCTSFLQKLYQLKHPTEHFTFILPEYPHQLQSTSQYFHLRWYIRYYSKFFTKRISICVVSYSSKESTRSIDIFTIARILFK